MSKAWELLDELVERCTVRVMIGDGPHMKWGTGFFVAPGRILTCAHVVTAKDGSTYPRIRILHSDGIEASVTLDPEDVHGGDFPDLAMLTLDLERHPVFDGHPVVMLDDRAERGDNVYAYGYGYSEVREPGASMEATIEGRANPGRNTLRKGKLLQLRSGQVLQGLSGAALVNQRTAAVCGVVKGTRDYTQDLGGWAIPISQVQYLYHTVLTEVLAADTGEWQALRQRVAREGSEPKHVPPLLAYECNRTRQREQLRAELKSHISFAHRPFICFVHGRPQESPEAFVEHAFRVIVPRAFDQEDSGLFHAIQWPVEGGVADRWEEIQGELNETVVNDRDALPGKLAAALALRQSPTVLSTTLYSRHWRRDERRLILQWLRFWADFPDLPPKKGVIVFAHIQYHGGDTRWWTSWWAELKAKQIARFLVKKLKEEAGPLGRPHASDPRVSWVVLDQLRPVGLSDAKHWAVKYASRYCAGHLDLVAILNLLYQKRRTVPMQELAGEFNMFLSNCSSAPSAS